MGEIWTKSKIREEKEFGHFNPQEIARLFTNSLMMVAERLCDYRSGISRIQSEERRLRRCQAAEKAISDHGTVGRGKTSGKGVRLAHGAEWLMQEWCERNFINQKRMREAERIMHEILDELDNSPLRVENRIAFRS